MKPQVIKLAQDTTDAEFKKQWDILKPQVIDLVTNLTIETFNKSWEKLKPTIIQLSTHITIEQFNRSWTELKPQVIELAKTTTNTKFDERWTELRPQLIELAQTTTSDKFDEKWTALQPTLTETVNNLAKTQTTTTFNEEWTKLKPQVIELAQTTTSTKFDEKWTELQPTLTETVNNLVDTKLETFKSTLWQEVTKNESFPFLLPENFGAVGDGTTDDTTAFSECFDEAMNTEKPILLTNKKYLITRPLNGVGGCNIIGTNNQIIVNDNIFINNTQDVSFKNINFFNIAVTNNDIPLIKKSINTYFENCTFRSLTSIFGELAQNTTSQLLNNCKLYDTSIYNMSAGVTPTENNVFIVNNTTITNINNKYYAFWYGKTDSKVYFNNCKFTSKFTKFNTAMFITPDNLIFNNCIFNVKNTMAMIDVSGDNADNCIFFNKCNINVKSIVDNNVDKYLYLNIKDSTINTDKIMTSNFESSLWLENNVMNTKPIINSGTGKVNLVEIQQKYSKTSVDSFPWISEIPSTYENNVKLVKVNNTEYFVLTENKYMNVKKLDYYFNYNLNYLPNAPYYNNTITFISNLGLKGYTAKKALLNNELCKLKNESGELIDYVYMMLDECTVDTVEDIAGEQTTITMKFLPYFAKLKTDTAVAGQCDVNMCISIILEKTSS